MSNYEGAWSPPEDADLIDYQTVGTSRREYTPDKWGLYIYWLIVAGTIFILFMSIGDLK